jgi:hypothetical protein
MVLNRDSEQQVEALVMKLKRRFLIFTRQVQGSLEVSHETAKLLRNVTDSNVDYCWQSLE